jgi:copper transport protein
MSIQVVGRRLRGLRVAALALSVATLGLAISMTMGTAPASAHAQLLDTNPQEGEVLADWPQTAELRFNEPVRLIDGGIRLLSGDGTAPFTLAAQVLDHAVIAVFPSSLPDGAYALSYRVVSADGHALTGAITFRVGLATTALPGPDLSGDSSSSTSEGAVAWLTAIQYLALLIFGGLTLFEILIAKRSPLANVLVKRLVKASFVTALTATALLVPVSAISIVGTPLSEIFSNTWLSAVMWQTVTVLGVVALAGGAAVAVSSVKRGSAARYVALALTAVAVCAPVLVGHSQTVAPFSLMVWANIAHLLAGAFWAGGVIGLLRYLSEDAQAKDAILLRFSSFALIAVSILVISGTTMALLILPSWDALLGTVYGRILLLKVGVVVAVVCFAAWNRVRLMPREESSVKALVRRSALTRILSYEAALLVTVLLVSGFLTNTSPVHDHSNHGSTLSQTINADSQGLNVSGAISDFGNGGSRFTFTLSFHGEQITPSSVEIQTRMPELDLGPFKIEPELDATTGKYAANLQLPVGGEWQLQVSTRVSKFEIPTVIIPITVP